MMFSIIIPMYNLEDSIRDTLESILKNDLSECELLLLDDGSKDKTVEVAEALLKEKCPCYYAIIKKENTGVSDTRNQGIKAAKGKYIIFCDGDDFFEPDLMSVLREELDENVDMAAWPYYILQDGNRKLSQKNGESDIFDSKRMMRLHLLDGYRMRLGAFAIKRECLTKANLFFTKDCTFAEDMEFIMKCILNSERIQWIQSPLFCYVKREGSLVNSYNLRRFEAPRTIERVVQYMEQKQIHLDDDLEEYMQNGLFVLHYVYSLEGCLVNLQSLKDGNRLWQSIQKEYNDVEKKCRQKMKSMRKTPYGISSNRLRMLKVRTSFYIQLRIALKKIRGR